VNKDSASLTIFLLFFVKGMWLLVAKTNKFYSKYIDTLGSDSKCMT